MPSTPAAGWDTAKTPQPRAVCLLFCGLLEFCAHNGVCCSSAPGVSHEHNFVPAGRCTCVQHGVPAFICFSSTRVSLWACSGKVADVSSTGPYKSLGPLLPLVFAPSVASAQGLCSSYSCGGPIKQVVLQQWAACCVSLLFCLFDVGFSAVPVCGTHVLCCVVRYRLHAKVSRTPHWAAYTRAADQALPLVEVSTYAAAAVLAVSTAWVHSTSLAGQATQHQSVWQALK